MSGRGDAAGNAIFGSEVEIMWVACWPAHGSLGLYGVSITVCDAYGDIGDDIAPDPAGSDVSCLVEYDDKWNLGDIPLSGNANGAQVSV